MKRRLPQLLLLSISLLLCTHCAQIVPLSGGKRDTTPPKLIEAIPFNKSTNFNSNVITLQFDEFVNLKDLTNQLIVTPKIKTAPEITASGKKIQIILKREELLPNTTYRFYFGSSIIDMNEGNPLSNFDYVFSTGTYIDSLKIRGFVFDAFNNQPSDKILIGLYSTNKTRDSLPYLHPPDYVTKSNESGEFVLGNLPYSTFKVFGFLDKNKNNLYDGEPEKIAFLNNELELLSDTSIKLNLFQEESPKSFIKKTINPYYGFTQLILNKKAFVKISTLKSINFANISETNVNKEKDTVSLYYKNVSDTLDLTLSNLKTKHTDTLKIALPKNNSTKKKYKSYTLNTLGESLALNAKLRLTFQTWMDTTKVNMSQIKLSFKQDSLITVVQPKGRWLNISTFEITNKLKEGIDYTLKIDTAAFFDVNGFTNDSIKSNFKTQSKVEFGKVTLKLLFNKKQNYIVQLLSENNQVVNEQFVSFSLSSSNAASIDFIDVTPGTYQIKIIFDDNENKKWDSGNLLLKQQAETVFINSKQVKVVSDWEIEEENLIKD